jgi:3-methyl-2-oxobutanoate hydroxymethyltransferase
MSPGPGCDTQFLFSDDIFGDYDERLPRHAKAYRDFAAEHRRLQQERPDAFREYVADVNEGRFPERSHLVEMEAPFLDEVMSAIGGMPPPARSANPACVSGRWRSRAFEAMRMHGDHGSPDGTR